MTSEKALIYPNAYAIRPPPRSTFKGLLFNLHHHRAHSKPHNIASSSPRLAYISIWLICLDLLYRSSVFLEIGKKMLSFKQMSSGKEKKLLCGVFLHLHQFKPMTSLIVILSITLISSSLPPLSLGTCDCTLSIRTKLLWPRSNCYLLNYILLLCTTQGRMRGGKKKRCNTHFLTVNRLPRC